MRTFKHFLVIFSIVVVSILMTKSIEKFDSPLIVIVGLIPMAIIIIQLSLKSKLFMKPFFTSRYNILTSKYELSNDYEIPSDLLFEKVVEVLKEHGFKKVQEDRNKGLIFAQASITFKSWGENLYFTVSKLDENNTELLFESVAFQLYSWGKNEDNANRFFSKLEESLII